MSDTLRIAVIGAGYWGPNLVRNFRASPHWELSAVCDVDPNRARRLAGPGTGVRVATSVEDLLDADDVDAVAIATPAATHHDIAHAALAAGKHVLVEKPLADTGERFLDQDVLAGGERRVRDVIPGASPGVLPRRGDGRGSRCGSTP